MVSAGAVTFATGGRQVRLGVDSCTRFQNDSLAEGIETVELATTLATLGCASGQGFYFAPPLEVEAALGFWRSRAGGTSPVRKKPDSQ